MSEMKYYATEGGVYLGGWDANPPIDSIEVPTAPADARQVWNFTTQVWGDIPEPEPVEAIPQIYAIAHMTIEEGAISSITPSARIGGAFHIDVGVYWVFFASPQPDADYIPLCYNHSHDVTVSERYEDFFVVTAELDGLPSDPPSFSVEIKRVN